MIKDSGNRVLSVGDKVTFLHYGTYRTGGVARFSKCGSIIYLTDGRWLHPESVTLA